MNILRFVNCYDNSIESYNALNSAIIHKKNGHNVFIMADGKSWICDMCIKNNISFINNTIFSRFGFLKNPDVDIIEIYGYSESSRIAIKKLISTGSVIIFRILKIPDDKTIEFIKANFNEISIIITTTQTLTDELIFNGIDFDKIFSLNSILMTTRWESAKQIKSATFNQRPYKIANVYRKLDLNSVKFFIMVAKEILKSMEGINFLIVGPKDDRIRDFARDNQISHKVDLLSYRDDMPEVMAMAHIYVKTNTSPDVSRSLIEAMASSVCCVVPNVKGTSDFVISDYNGIITKPYDIDSYVKSITELLKSPVKMQIISDTAHKYVMNNFSSDIITRVEETIYNDLIFEKKYVLK